MPIPDYQTLMLPVLKRAANSSIRIPEIDDQVADEFGLSEEERLQMLPSGRQRLLHNRMHWAKFYLSKAGLVISEGGRFISSDAGTDLIAQNLPRIDNEVLLRYPTFVDFYRGGAQDESKPSGADSTRSFSAVITPEEQIEAAHSAIHSSLRTDLLQRVLQNSPAFFEQVIVDLLVAMGYGGTHRNAAERLGRSGDGGVDGVINADRLGLDRVYV